MNATIRDVAREARVSVATVSRALNGTGNVAEAVRVRVLEAATRLRYTPHAAARSLSSRRTQTLGVVLPDLHGEFFSELVRGIDLVARQHGLHLLVSSYHGHPDEQGAALRAMRGRVDGLLVLAPFADEATLKAIAGSLSPLLPAVLINAGRDVPGYAALRVDNHGGAMAMVEHLAERGRGAIAFIAGPADNVEAQERQRGYVDALARHRPGQPPWIVEGDFSEASGHRAAQVLLAATPPQAVFAANDMMALGCMFALAERGVRVPGEIAVAGFDDIPLARYVRPSLTTMQVDIAALGSRAARRLLAQMHGEPDPGDDTVRPQLVVRDSTRSVEPP